MADSTSTPCLPDLVPQAVTQDTPFDGIDINPLPFVPDASFGDWMAAGTEAMVAMSGCDNDCLKAWIVAVLVSIWGIQDMYTAQINAVYHLLHPMHPNHLTVI